MTYVANRVIQSLVVLWCVVTTVFFLGRLSADPTSLLLPQNAGDAERATLRHSLGLDKTVLAQYFDYVRSVTHLDLGRSYTSGLSVSSLLSDRLTNTVTLSLAAVILATAIAVPLGVAAALKRETWFDRAMLALAVLGQAIPPFWLAVMLILIMSVHLHLLPTSGIGGPLNFLMPALTLGSFLIAGLFRLVRSSMLEVLGEEYIKFARIKGLSEGRVIYIHALRNALLAPLTFAASYAGLIMGGTVITETIFNWPGIGQLAYQATLSRDLPVMQGVAISATCALVISSLFADLMYLIIDPRIRY